jgi:RNA polymerase subunit RPABC4/transcription elongation factor Spt4
MYCKNCGNEISDDSKFCKYCGENIENNESIKKIPNEETQNIEKRTQNLINTIEGSNEAKKENKKLAQISILIIVIMLIISLVIFFTYKIIENSNESSIKITNTDKTLTSRSATNNDISFSIDNSMSLSINTLITPNVDIKNLTLTYNFLDKAKNILSTKNKIIGNVSKGTIYTVSFSITEFSFNNISNIDSVSCTVSGGTVSYFV